MSTIKSSNEHLTLNADGSSKDIKFQANGVEKASISSSGAFTSTTIDATKLTGDLPAISGANLTNLPSNVTVATSAPSSPSAGDMWFDSTSGINTMKVYDGTSWDALTNKLIAYRYTKYTYVSASVSHHPNITRIYLIQDNNTKVQIYNASASDNCSDSGDIPSLGASYTHDAGSGVKKIFKGFGWYSSFGAGNRGANIKLEGSDDNSSWVQIGSTTDAQTYASCGEQDFYV